MTHFKNVLIQKAAQNDVFFILGKLHLLSPITLDELLVVTTNSFIIDCIEYCKGNKIIFWSSLIQKQSQTNYVLVNTSTKKDLDWKKNILHFLDNIHAYDLDSKIPTSNCKFWRFRHLEYKDVIEKTAKISPHIVLQVIKECNIEYELATNSRKKLKIAMVFAALFYVMGYNVYASSSSSSSMLSNSCNKSCSKLSKSSSGISCTSL